MIEVRTFKGGINAKKTKLFCARSAGADLWVPAGLLIVNGCGKYRIGENRWDNVHLFPNEGGNTGDNHSKYLLIVNFTGCAYY